MATASHSQALPRGRRLQRPGEFSRIRKLGRRLVVGCLILNWKEADKSRLGVVTSRKVGCAVIRSRARRLLRECFRRHQMKFTQPIEIVLVARRSIAEFKLIDVERDFLTAATRAGIIQGDK